MPNNLVPRQCAEEIDRNVAGHKTESQTRMTAETLITKRNKIFKIWYFPLSLIMSLVNSNQFRESFSQWKRLLRANLKKGFSEKKKEAAKLGFAAKKKKEKKQTAKMCILCARQI